MPQEPDQEEPRPKKSQKKADRDPQWLKNAGTFVAILATLATVFTGVGALQDKMEESKKTAAEEKTKQAKAETESATAAAAKAEADKQTASFHADEQRIALRLKTLELEHIERLNQTEYQRTQEREVAKLISDVFHPAAGSAPESELAQLAIYATPMSPHRFALLNALSAKLETAGSNAEVRLIFQLMRGIGVEALNAIAGGNRESLATATKLWIEYTCSALLAANMASKLATVPIANGPQAQLQDFIDKLALDVSLDKMYLSGAMANKFGELAASEHARNVFSIYPETMQQFLAALPYTSPRGLGEIRPGLDLAAYKVTESSRVLEQLLHSPEAQSSGMRRMDLVGCYLPHMSWSAGKYCTIDFSGAYVQGSDFRLAQFDGPTLKSLTRASVVAFGIVGLRPLRPIGRPDPIYSDAANFSQLQRDHMKD